MKLLHQGGHSTKREDQAYFNPKGKEPSTVRKGRSTKIGVWKALPLSNL